MQFEQIDRSMIAPLIYTLKKCRESSIDRIEWKGRGTEGFLYRIPSSKNRIILSQRYGQGRRNLKKALKNINTVWPDHSISIHVDHDAHLFVLQYGHKIYYDIQGRINIAEQRKMNIERRSSWTWMPPEDHEITIRQFAAYLPPETEIEIKDRISAHEKLAWQIVVEKIPSEILQKMKRYQNRMIGNVGDHAIMRFPHSITPSYVCPLTLDPVRERAKKIIRESRTTSIHSQKKEWMDRIIRTNAWRIHMIDESK